MDEPVDYYKILQVSREANTEVIKASYRVLCRQFHPDLAGLGADHSAMASVNMAYSVLCDSDKRRHYDEELLDYEAWLAEALAKHRAKEKAKEKENAKEAAPPPKPEQARATRPQAADQRSHVGAATPNRWMMWLQVFYVTGAVCTSAYWMLYRGIWIEF